MRKGYMEPTIQTVIIGAGNAGTRFLRASQYLSSKFGKINVVGIAERDSAKLAALEGANFIVENDYKVLLKQVKCDLIIIATNDSLHYDILKYIADNNIEYKKIICEKPLVTEQDQIEFIRNNFAEDSIAVNFVERYSDVVTRLLEFIDQAKRTVLNVAFTWSKYRVKDPRPTVGVLSEITHPIDLACYIGRSSSSIPFQIISSSCTESDYVRGGDIRPDSIMVRIKMGNLLVSGTSSYLNSNRHRQMEFLLANQEGIVTELAVLNFDNPQWDDDSLKIYEITNENEKLKLLMNYDTPKNDRKERQSIEKICLFLEDVLQDISGEKSDSLAHQNQALFVQDMVKELYEHSIKGRVIRKMFRDLHTYSSIEAVQQLELIKKIWANEEYKEIDHVWDDNY